MRAAVALLLLTQTPARAERPRASFALVVGVNRAVDADLPVLRYADDDAALYGELFRALGARTYVLSRFDENTRRLHPQMSAEAGEPTERALAAYVHRVAEDVAQARARGVDTVFYFIYAGHGQARGGEGYIALEDGRLTGARLAHDVVQKVGAARTHLIVDACYSFYLAFSRGPGGARRPLRGFAAISEPLKDPNVGLLFSTSSTRESHEWEGFQSGIFSHEVRSALSGAADADGNGEVTYREISAFVERANAGIANERFRPDVYARSPRDSDTLVDLHPGLRQGRLEIESSGHFLVENEGGVRLVDFHNAPGQRLSLLRTGGAEPLWLRHLTDDREWAIPPASEEPIELAALTPSTPHAALRGAAHEAFERTFALPFDRAAVDQFVLRAPDLDRLFPPPPLKERRRRRAGWSLLGTGLGLAVTGVGLSLGAWRVRETIAAATPQSLAVSRNREIDGLNGGAVALYALGGAALAVSTALLVWPRSSTTLSVGLGGASLSGQF